MYSFNPDNINLPYLNISQSDTIDISNQYGDGDRIWLYVYSMNNSKNEAVLVRTESIGIKFLIDTNWAPQIIENL
jgi:hypothetical protein